MEGTRRGKKVRLAGRQPNFTPHVPSTDAVPSADELVGQHDHFRHAPRFELRLDMTRDDVIKIVKENVMEKGLPIVLSNALEYFGWDPALADPQWLVDNCADIPASLRDVTSAEDYVAGTLSSVVDHLRNGTRPPGTPESSVLYAKDMTCPKQLEDHLRDILPPYLQYLGPHDFAHYLPEKLQPVNLMLYGGGDGTFTPGHYDIGGSLGHNLMLHTDPGAYALWFLFEANDKHKAEDIWRSQKASLHLDNYFCPIETLKQQGSRGVPILVLEQRKGDFVILPPDCAHQVLNVGGKNAGEEGEAKSPGFNLKISWNRTTADSLRVSYREVLPRYRAVLKPEIYRVSAQIYFATRTIAEKVYKWCKPFMLRDASSPSDGTRVSTSPPSDAPSPCLKDLLHWVESLSILLPLLTEMVRDELVANKHGDFPNMDCDAVDMWPEHQEDPHSRTCDFCRCDIWNRGWTCVICSPPGGEEDGSAGAGAEDGGGKDRATSPGGSERHFDLCSNCYMLGRSCAHPAQMQFKGYLLIFRLRKYLHRFHEIYNAALDELQRMAGEPGSDVILDEAVRLHPLPNPLDKLYNFVQELPIPSAATAAYSLHLSLQKPQPKMCHACKSAKTDWIACPHCETKLCSACLWNRFAEKIGECRRRGRTWKCPRCRDDCNCIACMRSRQASFAKYPVPEGVVILAGWFPHLDGVPGLAVHDVNYPKGPSYQNAPIEIGAPPAEWVLQDEDGEEKGGQNGVQPVEAKTEEGAGKGGAGFARQQANGKPKELANGKPKELANGRPKEQANGLRRPKPAVSDDEDLVSTDSDGSSPEVPAPASKRRRTGAEQPKGKAGPSPAAAKGARRKRDAEASSSEDEAVARRPKRAALTRTPGGGARADVELDSSSPEEGEDEDAPVVIRPRGRTAAPRGRAPSASVVPELPKVEPDVSTLMEFLRQCIKMPHMWEQGYRFARLVHDQMGKGTSSPLRSMVAEISGDPADRTKEFLGMIGVYGSFEPTPELMANFRGAVEAFFESEPEPAKGPRGAAAKKPAAKIPPPKPRVRTPSPSPPPRKRGTSLPARPPRSPSPSSSSTSESSEPPRRRAARSRPAARGTEPPAGTSARNFRSEIEEVSGAGKGRTVRAYMYTVPGLNAVVMWDRETGWVNWTKLARSIGVNPVGARSDSPDVDILIGAHHVQGRWVTPKLFDELVAEECPQVAKFLGPMKESVAQIRAGPKGDRGNRGR